MIKFTFDNTDRVYWISKTESIRQFIEANKIQGQKVKLYFQSNIASENLSPFHIVLLACLIEHLDCLKNNVTVVATRTFVEYINDYLRLPIYMNGRKAPYVASYDECVLNLWKVEARSVNAYSDENSKYLQRHFFAGYDVSAFKGALDEVYYNIADHSESNGVAFSYIKYDQDKKTLQVAACDFGIGIPSSLRNSGKVYATDKDALIDSIQIGVSAKTQTHNRGLGLDNIISSFIKGGSIRIISNKAMLLGTHHEQKLIIKLRDADTYFNGTLIDFDVKIENFEKEEMLDYNIEL